jgi:hypothetical protein
VIAGAVVLGSFVSVMDISIVNVAMPQIGRQMHVRGCALNGSEFQITLLEDDMRTVLPHLLRCLIDMG